MDLKEIKNIFELEIAKTTMSVDRYEALSQPISPDNAIGRISRMDAINNKSVLYAALVKAKERLTGLKRNIETLGTKEFGVCPKCKNEIRIERILLAPESSFCVNCAF